MLEWRKSPPAPSRLRSGKGAARRAPITNQYICRLVRFPPLETRELLQPGDSTFRLVADSSLRGGAPLSWAALPIALS